MISCKKCGESVFWVTMQNSGKHNLLDAEPSATGDIVVIEEKDSSRKQPMARTVSVRNWPEHERVIKST